MRIFLISLLLSCLSWTHLSSEEILITCQVKKHITQHGGLRLTEPEVVLTGKAVPSQYQKKEFIKIDFDNEKLIDSSFDFRTKYSDIFFFEEPFAKVSGDFAIIHNDKIDPKISGDYRETVRLFRITGELIYETNINPLSESYNLEAIGFKVTRIYDCIKDNKKF